MNIAEAISVISKYDATEVIRDIYDGDSDLQSALSVLIPGFEYPDWSYRTIGEVEVHD